MRFLLELRLAPHECSMDFLKSLETLAQYDIALAPEKPIPSGDGHYVIAVERQPDEQWLLANEPRFIKAWPEGDKQAFSVS